MLWIALYLPELSLQLAQRGMEYNGPLVIRDGPANRPIVFTGNEAARTAGILDGMQIASAQVLCETLRISLRDVSQEDAALANIASWVGQFTPNVSIESRRGLLLEVEASLTLFGGLPALLGRLRKGIHAIGYHASWGVAPTALAAWLFARRSATHPGVRMCTDIRTLRARLAPLPITLFDWAAAVLEKFEGLGIRTISDCLTLPRKGLTQRLGQEIIASLDCALGEKPDPRLFFVPPKTFSARIELPAEVAEIEGLLFPLRRLLIELEGFLCGHGSGIQELVVTFEQAQRVRTQLTLGLLAPERNSARLLKLLQERFANTTLAAPVLVLSVQAETLLPYIPTNSSWLPDRQTQILQWTQLQDRLRARLGTSAVFTPHTANDHRPERAWSTLPLRDFAHSPSPRPLWLLHEPHALVTHELCPAYRGSLEMLAGPERIEAGWWDDQPIGRDYFVARNPRGETLWVYREFSAPQHWYLHGLFA